MSCFCSSRRSSASIGASSPPLATTHVPIVQPLAAVLHALDLRLRAVFLAYRLPLLVSATSLFVSLGLLELYLRHFPHTLPHALANHLTTPYHTGPSGIYRWAPELRTTLMHPNHERTIDFNGYWWRHKTDSRGFRNPVETLTASVVLLGDSIVYGHGVEEVSTIRHHLEAILGQPVANLGIQGSSIHNEYQVLKTFGLGLRARYVFLFFLANDIDDLGRLGEAALAAFLDTAVSDHATPFFDARPPKQPWWGARAYRAIETRWDDLSVVKAFDFLRGTVRARWGAPAEAFRGGLGGCCHHSPPVRGRSWRCDSTCMPCGRFRTWPIGTASCSSTSSHTRATCLTRPPTRRSSRHSAAFTPSPS